SHEPARSRCLRNMGAVYAAASSVLVFLSASTSSLLEKVRRREPVGREELLRLEEDDWVRRAGTYQGMVNSKQIKFVGEGETGNPVGGEILLNAVGDAIAQHRNAEQLDDYEFHKRYPHVDALATLIVDWFMADYAERPAYRIMSAWQVGPRFILTT